MIPRVMKGSRSKERDDFWQPKKGSCGFSPRTGFLTSRHHLDGFLWRLGKPHARPWTHYEEGEDLAHGIVVCPFFQHLQSVRMSWKCMWTMNYCNYLRTFVCPFVWANRGRSNYYAHEGNCGTLQLSPKRIVLYIQKNLMHLELPSPGLAGTLAKCSFGNKPLPIFCYATHCASTIPSVRYKRTENWNLWKARDSCTQTQWKEPWLLPWWIVQRT